MSRTAVTQWSRVLGKKFPESHLIPEPEVLCSVLVTKYNSGDQIKKKGMGGHGEEEKYIQDLVEDEA